MLTIKNKRWAALLIALPAVGAAIVFLLRKWIVLLSALLPDCMFNKYLGLYCPGCGNTRSVLALLRGDILTAARSNIVPLILIIFAALWYGELLSRAFGKNLHLVPQSARFYWIFGAAMLAYFILRNFNAFYFLHP